jgi:hypothetical protein
MIFAVEMGATLTSARRKAVDGNYRRGDRGAIADEHEGSYAQ